MENIMYKDINLVPQKCIVNSREECDTSVLLGNNRFLMPVYPANMRSVVDEDTCIFLAKKGWFYTMHRFGVDVISFSRKMKDAGLISSVSVGINGDSMEELRGLSASCHPDYITIDVANAWTDRVRDEIDYIHKNMPSTFVIVGNVATADAVEEIQSWGADALKTGIAGGKVCITKDKTGFSRGMVTTLLDCVPASKVPVIADGGIEQHGDIAKALVLGAKMVMAGHLFSGYLESAGEIIEIENQQYKEYFGSASKYNKKEVKNIEGKKILVQYRGSIERLLDELVEDLRSSISYGGGKKLEDLKNVPWEIRSV